MIECVFAVALVVLFAWLIHIAGLPPHPKGPEPHSWRLRYDPSTEEVTGVTWCPECRKWQHFQLRGAAWIPSCKHWPHDTTERGWREIRRFQREQEVKHGGDPWRLDFFNACDRACYGEPVRGVEDADNA